MAPLQRLVCVCASVGVASIASGQYVTPTTADDGWDRGVTPFSTFADWDFFSSPFGPNAPQAETVVGTIPVGAPSFDAFDLSAATSGSFISSGGNIYSFGGVITPETVSPGFGLGYGHKTTVIFQTQTLGSEPDNASFLVNNRWEASEVVILDEDDFGGAFGGIRRITLARFEFARNDLEHSVFFSAASTSLSFDRGIIDTFTEPLPCAVDLDLNDEVDFFDTLEFLKDIDAGSADWNEDGDTTSADFVDFVTAAEAGCDP